MTFLTFLLYVLIVYVIYYVLIFSCDLLKKTSKSEGDEASVEYNFASDSQPKVARLYNDDEDEPASGQKLSLMNSEETVAEKINQKSEIATSVDLSLESITSNRVHRGHRI